MKIYFVYILANGYNGTLYIGVTSNLKKRVYQHKSKEIPGFTQKYTIDKLVYYEQTTDIHPALKREKQLKAWKRQWKLNLIHDFNPNWKDLYNQI